MSTPKIVAFWGTCLLFVAGRFAVPGHGLSWPGTYEALAHIWVGAVLAAWWFDRRNWLAYAAALGATTALEVVMFLNRG
jgi:hypothetical protein